MDTGRVPENCVERDPPPFRAGNQDRRRAVRRGVDHRHQVCDGGKAFFLGAGLATAPPVVGNGLVADTDAIQLRAPHAAVADARVQEDDGITVANDLYGQRGAAGRNLVIAAHALSSPVSEQGLLFF